jgi:hypothetical protein
MGFIALSAKKLPQSVYLQLPGHHQQQQEQQQQQRQR